MGSEDRTVLLACENNECTDEEDSLEEDVDPRFIQ